MKNTVSGVLKCGQVSDVDYEGLKRIWHITSLLIALTTLLFFAVYGFHNILLHEKVTYMEPNMYMASLEFSMSILALTGIFYLLLTEYNPYQRRRSAADLQG